MRKLDKIYYDFPISKENMEDNFPPSMVEDVNNPTIAQIVANPQCLLRQHGTALFDTNEDFEEVEERYNDDIQAIDPLAIKNDLLQTKSEEISNSSVSQNDENHDNPEAGTASE